jgi:hypothetical protein
MTKSRPNALTKPTYKAPRKPFDFYATRGAASPKPSSPKAQMPNIEPKHPDWWDYVMGQLHQDHNSVTPKLPQIHIIAEVQEKLSSFHTLFNFSVDPDFINTPGAIKLLDHSIELHTDFINAFGLIDRIVRRYVVFTKDDQKPKRKVKTTGLEARAVFPSRSTKVRKQICLSSSSSSSEGEGA